MLNRYGALILFLALFPLAALGHDVYIYSQDMDKGLKFSDIGYVWSTYAPQHYLQVRSVTPAALWVDLGFILEQKTLYVAIAVSTGLFMMMLAQYAFLKVVFGNIGGGARIFAKERTFTREELLGKKPTAFKYKRR